MRTGLILLVLLLLLPVTVVVQDLLPAVPPVHARIQLLPVLFCFGVLALPLLPALWFALVTAVVQGLLLIQIQSGTADFGLTIPVVFFLLWAIVLQMAGEATHGMRWELHAIGSAVMTLTLLCGEFLMLGFTRGGLLPDMNAVLKIAIPTGAALLVSPLLYLLLGSLVPVSPHAQKQSGTDI